MTVVAAIGLVLNGATALLFATRNKSDLNVRGVFMQIAADASVSAGVIVAGLLILLIGWLWLGPTVSLLINLVAVWSTRSLLRDSITMSLDAVPEGIDTKKVRAFLESRPGVGGIHDPLVDRDHRDALTAHLVMPESRLDNGLVHAVADALENDFGIGHTDRGGAR